MSEQPQEDPGGENLIDNPDVEYDGTPYASDHNIQAARENVTNLVQRHIDGMDNAVYMGAMTPDEVKDEHDAGLYAYVFLKDGDKDPEAWIAVSKVHGEDVRISKMTRTEMRTWHPFNLNWGGEA